MLLRLKDWWDVAHLLAQEEGPSFTLCSSSKVPGDSLCEISPLILCGTRAHPSEMSLSLTKRGAMGYHGLQRQVQVQTRGVLPWCAW